MSGMIRNPNISELNRAVAVPTLRLDDFDGE